MPREASGKKRRAAGNRRKTHSKGRPSTTAFKGLADQLQRALKDLRQLRRNLEEAVEELRDYSYNISEAAGMLAAELEKVRRPRIEKALGVYSDPQD